MPPSRKLEKWTDMRRRYSEFSALHEPPCMQKTVNLCHVRIWQKFVHTLNGLRPLEQLNQVNHYINGFKYIEDIVNYGVQDYWATPQEFVTRNGDCEDFAIAKFFSLLALGLRESQMRVVVVRDLNLKLNHAILSVRLNGTDYVLDNQINYVIPANVIFHYQPVYSVNDRNWWFYVSLRAHQGIQ